MRCLILRCLGEAVDKRFCDVHEVRFQKDWKKHFTEKPLKMLKLKLAKTFPFKVKKLKAGKTALASDVARASVFTADWIRMVEGEILNDLLPPPEDKHNPPMYDKPYALPLHATKKGLAEIAKLRLDLKNIGVDMAEKEIEQFLAKRTKRVK